MKTTMKRFYYSMLLLALSLAGSGCQEIDPPTQNAGGGDVESYYQPLPGKKVARVVYRSDFTRTYDFTYDALDRIKKTVCTTESSNGKTTTEEHEYRYGKDFVLIDGQRCPLNENGCITEIQRGSATMSFLYDGLMWEVSYESSNSEPMTFRLNWKYNSITHVSGGMDCQLEYDTDYYYNGTNLDITAIISNAYYVFEMWIGGSIPPIGTFGFFFDRDYDRPLLPTAETYRNEIRTTFEYEFTDDEPGCPSKIYCSSNGKDAVITFEYVE